MSRKERVVAGLLLVVAVVGGALMPRLLASPATAPGIALGPSPGPGIVHAPTIPTAPHHSTPTHTLSPVTAVASNAPVTPVVVQPKPAASTAFPKHVPAPSP